ncbi:MAG: glycosyltransferase family 39 protein, partial [Chitinivibrionales bacterium]|nr:glycosyltransferase family 39 protein [Chitinivibrionales bacterium]
NLLYTGIHFILFKACIFLSLDNPQIQMTIIRLLHAAFSLLSVWYGYKIARKIGDEKSAFLVGLALSVFWFFPFMSVRNLVEFVCIPPLLMMVWYALKSRESPHTLLYGCIAGIAAGFAFVIRYQTAPFIGIFFCIAVMRKEWKFALSFGLLFVVVSTIILGLVEGVVYDAPFATFLDYFSYNSKSDNINAYPVNPFYTYIGTILAFLIPPSSIFLIAGFFKRWNKLEYIIWPTVAFLIFHSIYPNKQERFILPAIPFLLIEGIIGWRAFVNSPVFMKSKFLRSFSSFSWRWFWSVNTILLLILTITYTKKTRVESAYFLYGRADRAASIIIENEDNGMPYLPFYYAGIRPFVFELPFSKSVDTLVVEIATSTYPKPYYVFAFGAKNFDERILRMEKMLGKLSLVKTLKPSLVDNFFYIINPRHNKNQICRIYNLESP